MFWIQNVFGLRVLGLNEYKATLSYSVLKLKVILSIQSESLILKEKELTVRSTAGVEFYFIY